MGGPGNVVREVSLEDGGGDVHGEGEGHGGHGGRVKI